MIRTIPPVPPEFQMIMETQGWEAVERLYNARTDLILKWQHITGAKCRKPKQVRA